MRIALSTTNCGQVTINCLCWSLIFESRVLTTIEQPYNLLFVRSRVAAIYDHSLLIGRLMREHLEDADFDIVGCRGALTLQLAVDQILKKHFSTNHQFLNNTYPSPNDGLAVDGAELTTGQKKALQAHQAHLYIDSKVQAIFSDRDAAKIIYERIDEEAIAKAMVEQFRTIGTIQSNGLRSAVREELEALDFTHWSESTESESINSDSTDNSTEPLLHSI